MKHLTRSHIMLAIGLIIVVVLLSLPFPFYSRLWHKLLHIVGAVLFIGNIVIAAVWMSLARVSQQVKVIHFAAKVVMLADILFTIPGVLLLFINGAVLAPAFGDGNIFGASWVAAAVVLLIVSGIVWAGFLLRYQGQLIEFSATGDQVSSEFYAAFKNWTIWGIIATILPILSLVLMVFKPTLWG
jgi:uncharacterized membrane protein